MTTARELAKGPKDVKNRDGRNSAADLGATMKQVHDCFACINLFRTVTGTYSGLYVSDPLGKTYVLFE